jgi:hypothetical protein
MATYSYELAQDAVCQSHTGRLTGFWFLINRGKTSTTMLKASRQKHRSWQLYSKEDNGLQHFQIESCQPIKILKNKKKLTGRVNGLDKKYCQFYRLSSSRRCCSIYYTPLLMAPRSTGVPLSPNDRMSEYSLRYYLSVVIFAKLLYDERNAYSRQRIHVY